MLSVRLLAVALLALCLAGCTGSEQPAAGRSTPGEVVELASLDTLRSAFDDDKGRARILLLLSPT